MNNIQDTIDKIKQGNFNKEELSQYLESTLVLIKANAIMAIIKFSITESSIINKLYEISLRVNLESKVIGVWTNGHLAMAALKLLNTNKALELFESSINQVDVDTRKDIEKLINQLPQII